MKDIKISVIIPVYNCGNAIRKAIENLSDQNFDREYEVILVDDSSTDNSVQIIKEMIEKQDHKERFRLLCNEHNMRAGGARNNGIKNACGEYVLFVDQDDYPAQNMLKKLYELTDFERIDVTACEVIESSGKKADRVIMSKTNLSLQDKRKLIAGQGYVFAMLIRRKTLTENNIYFPEHVLFEDLLYNALIFDKINSFASCSDELYYRTFFENSQTTTPVTYQKVKDRVENTVFYLNKLGDRYFLYKEELDLHVLHYVYMTSFWTLLATKLFNYNLAKRCLKICKEKDIDCRKIDIWEKGNYSHLIKSILKYAYKHPKHIFVMHYFIVFLLGIKKVCRKMIGK